MGTPWAPWGRHTGLLLLTANEKSTAPGDTRRDTLWVPWGRRFSCAF